MRFIRFILPLAVGPLLAQSGATPGFSASSIDKNANPCVDFYQYACGAWMANNPIPSDQARWGRFNELGERNRAILRDILEKSSRKDPKRSPIEQKMGDYYSSCMEEGAIEKAGAEPLKPDLDRIAALADKTAIAKEVAWLHSLGVNALFRFSSGQDFKDSTQVIAQADQGGLALPDRDYYLKTDPKSVDTRQKYQAHVEKMFQLLGNTLAAASAKAKVVVDIETELAKGSLDRVSRRDPSKIYHKMTREQVAALTPSFRWPKYLEGIGAPPVQHVNVSAPEFFRNLEALLNKISLDDWRTYLSWHLVTHHAALLSSAFEKENFELFSKTLTGAKEMRPRWNRCVSLTDQNLGDALGQKYVDLTFGVEGKQRTLKMVEAIEKAMAKDIRDLSWMTAATKQQAIVKLNAIANKIGYPNKWRDYSGVDIVRGDLLGNSQRSAAAAFKRRLSKIGKPVERGEWFMTPSTVNAFYSALLNDINFPAGILQPPFYDNNLDDAVNFGGIGAVIGHELTHGFDDHGSRFDAQGNLRDWWTAEDSKEFQKRTGCVADEYSAFTSVADVKLNGKLTLGENTADNGGVRLAYMALMELLSGKDVPKIDGFNPQQRFFLGYAQIWCENHTEESLRMRATIDPHSPGRFRVNGVLSNMPEFQSAFSCKEGQPMVRENACRVW